MNLKVPEMLVSFLHYLQYSLRESDFRLPNDDSYQIIK